MSSSLGSLVPMVTSFHWDDLVQQFRLKITFELKTPLGNFFKEEIVTVNDLAGVVAAIYNILTAATSIAPGYDMEYNVGDFSVLGGHLATLAPPSVLIPSPTLPEEVPLVPDGGAWNEYREENLDFPWGTTAP